MICANHWGVLLSSVFTVNHTIWKQTHRVHAVVLIRFSISINIARPSTTVDVKDAKQPQQQRQQKPCDCTLSGCSLYFLFSKLLLVMVCCQLCLILLARSCADSPVRHKFTSLSREIDNARETITCSTENGKKDQPSPLISQKCAAKGTKINHF